MCHAHSRPDDRDLTAAGLAELPIIGLPQDANAYHSMVDWFGSPRLIHRCNNFSVVALLVRGGVGISLLPQELFAGDLDAGTLKVLLEHPKAADMDYSAAYLNASNNPLLAEVAALAREEKWFLGAQRTGVKRSGAEFFLAP
jgi:DNA-binding transcriptional LysR family regulator